MSIFTQFLPGFRETRIPLAVGALWVIAGALTVRLLPATLLHGEFVGQVTDLGRRLPDAVLGAGVLFGIYLVGIILGEAGSIVVRLVVAVANLIPVVGAVLILLVLLARVFPLLMFALVFVGVVYNNWRQVKDVSFAEYLSQAFDRVLAKALRSTADAWQAVISAWDPSREQINLILREESGRALANRADLRTALVDALPIRRLADVVRAVELHDNDLRKRIQVLGVPAESITVSKALRRLKVDPELPAIVRAAVSDKVAINPKARRAFISTAINTSLLRDDIKDRVDRTHVHLRAEFETIYNQYDRLKSEGEFRIAVATPLCAVLVAVSMLIVDDLKIESESLLYAASALAAAAMLVAGGTKRTEASQLLYSSIRQELVKNADRRDYGIEYFPIRYLDLGIDLPTLASLTPRPLRLRLAALRADSPLRRLRKKLKRKKTEV